MLVIEHWERVGFSGSMNTAAWEGVLGRAGGILGIASEAVL